MSSVMTLRHYPSQGGMTFGKIGARRMMWDVNNLLPKGGRWVEYLENTGTQWINTRLDNIYSTDIVKGTIAVDNSAAITENVFLFGIYQQGLPYFYMARFSPSFGKILYVNIIEGFVLGRVTSNLQEFIFTNGNRSFGGSVDANSSGFAGPWTPPFVLFGYNNRGTGVPCAYPGVRFGSYSVERNGVKLIDLKPIAIGTTGYMLDLVSGEYLPYGNQGTGDFVIGPDAPPPTI